MQWLGDIRLIVMDLDGTLYRDAHFIPRYVGHLLHGHRQAEEAGAVIREAEEIVSGRHNVAVGSFYDPIHGTVLRHDEASKAMFTVHTWDGQALDEKRRQELYGSSIRPGKGLIHIGDEWGVVAALARRLGVSDGRCRQAFRSVREEMLSQSGIRPYAPLIEALRALEPPRFRKLLITNAPSPTGFAFVRHLGLGGLFDSYIFDGGKPDAMPDHLKSWMRRDRLSCNHVVSIGDNARNDLLPIQWLGGRTVLMSPYASKERSRWDAHVRSLDELVAFLERLAAARNGG